MRDYDDHDMTGLAALVRAGDVTPHDLLDAALARAADRNPAINALVHQDEDVARQMIDDGLPEGSFPGVPFLIKDIGCETPDFPVSNGSRITPGTRYPEHSSIYARLRAAGLVPFARTTIPEFAIGSVTEAAAYGGPTRNPWNLDRTPGGSSGGSGAAVAAGIVPGAHGSDGGGSIRIPASCCGLFGFKASRALIPDGPYAGEGWGGMAMDGFLTRSVRDTAALLDATGGPDLGAPYYPPPMRGTFLQATGQRPKSLRIALCTTTIAGEKVHPDCAAATMQAATLLADLGHHVEETRPHVDLMPMMQAWTWIVACGTASAVRAVEHKRGEPLRDQLETVAQGACALADRISGADYLDALNTVHDFGRQMAAFFQSYDVFVTPVLAEPPAEIGRFAHSRPEFADFAAYRLGPGGVFEYSPFTAAYNASGQPAMSVPLYWNTDGLPIGVQIGAASGRDEMLMSLAAQLEDAQPWFDGKPPRYSR